MTTIIETRQRPGRHGILRAVTPWPEGALVTQG